MIGDKTLKIVHDIDDWMYDLEQINKERDLTRKEYCIYNHLVKLKDKYYEIYKQKIKDFNRSQTRIGACVLPSAGNKRFNTILKNNRPRPTAPNLP